MKEEKKPGPHTPPAGEETPAQEAPAREIPAEGEDKPLTPGQRRRRQQSVFQYITILFGAAFVLLLLTFLMERRQFQQLQEQNEAQIDDLQQSSVNAVQSLTNLTQEHAALKEENQALQEENQGLSEENEALRRQLEELTADLDKTSQAMDWFWQIDEAYVRGRYTLCRELMDSLEAAGLKEYLPRESVTDNGRFSPYDRYQEIYDALN